MYLFIRERHDHIGIDARKVKMLLMKLILLLLVVGGNGLKILLYQTAIGKSHMRFSGTLVDKLVERGHVVVS